MSDYGLASFEAQEAFAQSDWLRPPAAIRPEVITPEAASEIETVCAWCVPHKHLSGPVGAAKVSHGICADCLAREFPEMAVA